MTIYLHLKSLAHICSQHSYSSSPIARRTAVRAYRDDVLKQVIPHLQIKLTEFGKPIANNQQDFVFNHSHSQSHYALVYSQDVMSIGVDIEDLSRNAKFMALAQRCFHKDEFENWQAAGLDPVFWFKVWTTKEAAVKAHGLGIRLELNSINTNVAVGLEQGCFTHNILGVIYYKHIQNQDSMITIAYQVDIQPIDCLNMECNTEILAQPIVLI